MESKPTNAWVVWLPIMVFFAAIMMGADFAAIAFKPLQRLQIPYSPIWSIAHILVPVVCAAIWLATRRRWRYRSPILSVLLCLLLLPMPMMFAKSQVADVPVDRLLERDEESHLAYPIYQRTDAVRGRYIVIAPQHEQELRAELGRLGALKTGERQ